IPVACNSHTQTQTITTTFRIDLMLEAIGMYRLIRCNATPTRISTTTRLIKGILQCSSHGTEQSPARCRSSARIASNRQNLLQPGHAYPIPGESSQQRGVALPVHYESRRRKPLRGLPTDKKRLNKCE